MPITQKPEDKPVADKTVADTSAPAETVPPVVTPAPSTKYTTKPGDAGVDPRTGEAFKAKTAGLKGQYGMEIVTEPGDVVQGVDPDAIPAEVTPGVSPDAGGDKLLAAAQAKAPGLTKEFVKAFDLNEQQVAMIARGAEPPPPTPGPIHTNDLYLTPGGWQVTAPGVPPEDVGKNAIGRS
jgi:hypothetical protein